MTTSKPPYEFTVEDLVPGDVVFSHTDRDLARTMQAINRDTLHSHAGFYLGDGWTLDCRPPGIQLTRLDVVIDGSPTDVHVYRNPWFAGDPDRRRKLLTVAGAAHRYAMPVVDVVIEQAGYAAAISGGDYWMALHVLTAGWVDGTGVTTALDRQGALLRAVGSLSAGFVCTAHVAYAFSHADGPEFRVGLFPGDLYMPSFALGEEPPIYGQIQFADDVPDDQRAAYLELVQGLVSAKAAHLAARSTAGGSRRPRRARGRREAAAPAVVDDRPTRLVSGRVTGPDGRSVTITEAVVPDEISAHLIGLSHLKHSPDLNFVGVLK